jgi:opacity protein-like surface antigen
MRMPPKFVAVALSLAFVAPAISAQSLSFGLRGSGNVPTGDFADNTTSASTNATLISGAKAGFGYGADVGLGLGLIGIYAGFDHVQFDCETTTCTNNGKYTLQGVTVGAKVSLPGMDLFRPYVKGGVTFNNLKGNYGSGTSSTSFETDQTPGYEVGVGGDLGVLGLVSISPQVRYIGQNLKAKIPGVTTTGGNSTGVNYYSFDLGLSVHTPFGH